MLVGVDIGGTKVSVCLGGMEGDIIDHKRVMTTTLGDPSTGLPKIVELIGHLLRDNNLEIHEIKAIGMAVPGPISYKKGMMLTPPNMPTWVNVPVREYFKEALDRPIFLNNDANAGVLAEWEFGAAKHLDNLVYLTMSTGMGGGIIAQGKLLQGETDTAGEVGHFVLDPKGPKCPCGQRGCFEVFCGGANLAHRIQDEIKSKKVQTAILDVAGGEIDKIDMKCVATAVKKDDAYALEIWEEFIERLAQGIGILLMTLNPDAIILGTIASHTHELVMTPLKRALAEYAWTMPLEHCRIEESRLSDQISKLAPLALAIEGLRNVEAPEF